MFIVNISDFDVVMGVACVLVCVYYKSYKKSCFAEESSKHIKRPQKKRIFGHVTMFAITKKKLCLIKLYLNETYDRASATVIRYVKPNTHLIPDIQTTFVTIFVNPTDTFLTPII